MPLFDLNKIGGTNYHVENTDTGDVITIKVIRADLLFEIMRAHQLQVEFLNQIAQTQGVRLIDLFENFVQDPLDVSWYTTVPNKLPTAEEAAVKLAAKEGNRIVVLECITPTPWEGFDRPVRKKKD